LPLFISACKKGELEMKSTEIGIDPAVNIDMVNQLLQCEGTLIEGNLPAKRKGFFGQIYPILLRDGTLKVDSVFFKYDDSLFVTFRISSMPIFYKIRSLQFKLEGANSFWKVDRIDDNSGEYAFVFAIPRLVKQSNLRIDFNAEVFAFAGSRRDSSITDSATIFVKVPKPLKCGQVLAFNTKGNGITQKQYILGDKAGKVKFLFNTGGIGDRLDVRYNGRYVISTCPSLLENWQFPKCNAPAECFPITREGNTYFFKEYTFDYDPAESKIVDVFVTGFCSDSQTAWELKVECPGCLGI
jgi:hypothetical protein